VQSWLLCLCRARGRAGVRPAGAARSHLTFSGVPRRRAWLGLASPAALLGARREARDEYDSEAGKQGQSTRASLAFWLRRENGARGHFGGAMPRDGAGDNS